MTTPQDNEQAHIPPFDNCKFLLCDLPGQCMGEGKCHHPISAKLEQYGKEWKSFVNKHWDTHQRQPSPLESYQAAFASREPEIQALREENEALRMQVNPEMVDHYQALQEEVERLKEYHEAYREEIADGLHVLNAKLLAAQLSERKLRELLGRVVEDDGTPWVDLIKEIREALSTPTNTDEADKLIKALEVAKDAMETVQEVEGIGTYATIDDAITTINELLGDTK